MEYTWLSRKTEDPFEKSPYFWDVEAIRKGLNKIGYDASFEDILWAWEDFSDTMAAGWMSVETDEDGAAIDLTPIRLRLH